MFWIRKLRRISKRITSILSLHLVYRYLLNPWYLKYFKRSFCHAVGVSRSEIKLMHLSQFLQSNLLSELNDEISPFSPARALSLSLSISLRLSLPLKLRPWCHHTLSLALQNVHNKTIVTRQTSGQITAPSWIVFYFKPWRWHVLLIPFFWMYDRIEKRLKRWKH